MNVGTVGGGALGGGLKNGRRRANVLLDPRNRRKADERDETWWDLGF